MTFLKDIWKLLKETTWPTKKEAWRDFVSVVEYTLFFVAIIYIFDKAISYGMSELLAFFKVS